MSEPRRLTPDVQQRIVGYVSEGNYPETSAILAGVPRRTFQRWLHDGRQDLEQGVEDSSVARLALAVERARAECVAQKVKRVQAAGEKSWQADAWWLERNLPALYGRNQQIQIESTVTVKVSALPALAEAEVLALIQASIEGGTKLLPPPPDTA